MDFPRPTCTKTRVAEFCVEDTWSVSREKGLDVPGTLSLFPPGLSYGWGSLPPGDAQQSPLPKAHTHFSHQASGVGESFSSGSQLLASLSAVSLDPEVFLHLPREGLPPTRAT